MSIKAFDFKKEYKDLYLPKDNPVLVDVPEMKFIMADGKGDPNSDPCFKQAVEILYSLSYEIKMSKMKGTQPPGYIEYVVPPLEGLWWVDNVAFSPEKPEDWSWTLMIRQPDFVTETVFNSARESIRVKKPDLDVGKGYFSTYSEGLCVQIMHIGPYSTEPESMKRLDSFIKENGLKDTIGSCGKHHEIYLSDPGRVSPENMKTVLRRQVERN